ncbi:MAG: PASTA domain-containing protein [Alloprevotella sp.]|nr:PASTA domain-containing protein [Alloprevotella sp.]MBR6339840.1 PASTA domain-containing protein [Alloprevotella sp.]
MSLKSFFQKFLSVRLWLNCLGMIVLALGIIIGGVAYLNVYTHHGETVKVPDVVGKNITSVKKQFGGLGIKVEVIDTSYIKTLPADIILQQSIKPGSIVKPGRIVQVTINSARPLAIVLPDIADNSSYREAVSTLRGLGFSLTEPKYVAGDRDWVVGIEAAGKTCKAGQRVASDVPITLVVGDGRVFEEYNGNDSLEYAINGDLYSEPDPLLEGEGNAE